MDILLCPRVARSQRFGRRPDSKPLLERIRRTGQMVWAFRRDSRPRCWPLTLFSTIQIPDTNQDELGGPSRPRLVLPVPARARQKWLREVQCGFVL